MKQEIIPLLKLVPQSLDVNELMLVRGGASTMGTNICIFTSATKCDGVQAEIKCDSGTPAVIKCENTPAVVSCSGSPAVGSGSCNGDTKALIEINPG